MSQINLATLMLTLLRGSGVALPIDVDFTALADGALPAYFTAPTWAISGGAAVNTPTLSAELLTDPGLEAAYTAGKCATFGKVGSPTLAESADVHGGSKAQEFTPVASGNALYFTNYTPVAGGVYVISHWSKRTAGTNDNNTIHLEQAGIAVVSRPITSATYDQNGAAFVSLSTTAIERYGVRLSGGNTPYDTVIVDDYSFKRVTLNDLFALAESGNPNLTVKIRGTWDEQGLYGIIARSDSLSAPQNFISLVVQTNYISTNARLYKWLSGAPTLVATILLASSGDAITDADLELRLSGNTVQVFLAGVQKGTDQTISDAAIVSNTKHGVLASGGSQIDRFFAGRLTRLVLGAFGSSITEPATSYAYLVRDWLRETEFGRSTGLYNQARSGNWPWSNIIRYQAELHANISDIYLTDFRIVEPGRDDRALEALCRRIYTDNPRAVIISPTFPVDETLDGAVDALDQRATDSLALAAHYGVHIVDYRQAVIDLVAGGASLTTYLADTIHPTVVGQQLCATMIEAMIVPLLDGEDHSSLPARLYDNGEYEQPPTRKNGTAYDSVTGSWTATGTRIESSSAGATVTFSATCSQFGIYNAISVYGTLDVQIDGGAWLTARAITHNGYYGTALTYAAHTIAFRIPAAGSIRIDEFWAI